MIPQKTHKGQSLFTRVREAHLTHGAGEVLLVVEALPGLHGAVGDVLRADGADHGGAHGEPGGVVSVRPRLTTIVSSGLRAGVTH